MNETKYIVREALPDDLDAACRCVEALYEDVKAYNAAYQEVNPTRVREILDARIRSKTSMVYLLEAEDEILGLIVGQIAKFSTCYVPIHGDIIGKVTEVYVAESVRGQSAAGLLWDKLAEWFRTSEVCYVEAEILAGNMPSERFFSRQGFSTLSRTVFKLL